MQQLRSTFKINNRIKQSLQILFALLFILLTAATKTFAQNKIILAENSKAKFIISLPVNSTVVLKFAGSELSKYLTKITGASFQIKHNTNQYSIKLIRRNGAHKEWYTIAVKANNIILSGNSDSLQSFYASTILIIH